MRAAAGCWVGLATYLCSCATSPSAHPPARAVVRVDVEPGVKPCASKHGVHVEVVEGPVPRDAVRIGELTTQAPESASAPKVSIRAHEDAAKKRAGDYCADGVSVLQA